MRWKAAILSLSMVVSTPAWASTASASTDCKSRPPKPIPEDIMTYGFREAHPDLQWRAMGLGQYRDGKHTEAFQSFKKAAFYADKFSQSMVANMYWNGQGTEPDRALAYVWMDLAAERMYHDFLQLRELYWSMLDDSQRADAVHRGQAIFAEYADRVAKPRMEEQLLKVRRNFTGSRLGWVSSGLHVIPRRGPGAGRPIPGGLMYPPEYWDPEQYWCTQDNYWLPPQGEGKVDVGDLEQIPAVPPSGD